MDKNHLKVQRAISEASTKWYYDNEQLLLTDIWRSKFEKIAKKPWNPIMNSLSGWKKLLNG